MDTAAAQDRLDGPLTLAIDIGGSRLKAGLLDATGRMVRGPNRTDTPVHATPDAVLEALLDLARPLAPFDRIAVGFPGVVRRGRVLTAPNLGTVDWQSFPLSASLADALDRPVRMLNDAEVQGLGVVSGRGLECTITLGTGIGFALFQDGQPAPHLELSQHPLHKDKTYDQFIGADAYRKIGRKHWNRRVQRALDAITTLVGYDTLYIGGGNAKHLRLELPPNVQVVGNEAGITGGVRLWSPRLDWMFTQQSPEHLT